MSLESNTSKLQTARRPPRRAVYNSPLHPSICGPCLSSSPVSPWHSIRISGHVDPRRAGRCLLRAGTLPPSLLHARTWRKRDRGYVASLERKRFIWAVGCGGRSREPRATLRTVLWAIPKLVEGRQLNSLNEQELTVRGGSKHTSGGRAEDFKVLPFNTS